MGKTTDYFKDWMNKTVYYKKKLSMDGFGQVTFDTAETLDCYIHGTVTEVVNDKNEDVLSNQQIYLDGENATEAAIDFGDVFKVGSEVDDPYLPVKSIDKFYDEDGDLDLVVIFL